MLKFTRLVGVVELTTVTVVLFRVTTNDGPVAPVAPVAPVGPVGPMEPSTGISRSATPARTTGDPNENASPKFATKTMALAIPLVTWVIDPSRFISGLLVVNLPVLSTK